MKDALGHGSNANGLHSATINELPAKMTKAHFQVIAQRLQSAHPGANASPEALAEHSALISQYADRLALSNPRFDRQRFIEAVSGKGVRMSSRQSSLDNAAKKIDRAGARASKRTHRDGFKTAYRGGSET